MNLFFSIVTSVAITGIIWGLVLVQPKPAIAKVQEQKLNPVVVRSELAEVKAISDNEVSSELGLADISLVGYSKNIELSQVNSLVGSLATDDKINARMLRQPTKLYVYYRDFSANYDSALVFVGYDSKALVGAGDTVAIDKENYQTLLVKGNYQDEELIRAWQDINYNRGVSALLEIHYLAPNGKANASELLVAYKGGE